MVFLLKSPTSTCTFSNSTGSSVTNRRFFPISVMNTAHPRPVMLCRWRGIKNAFILLTTNIVGGDRFLDKAATKTESDRQAGPGRSHDPWRLVTVTQVEEEKFILRILPIWIASTIFSATPKHVRSKNIWNMFEIILS